ncbi:MAG: hypothetical protein JWO48_3580 [Bryobacterales bacterium]|nr:hypothetical protein [Bryobacterales bacterium]
MRSNAPRVGYDIFALLPSRLSLNYRIFLPLLIAGLCSASGVWAGMLGSFSLNDSQFGDTLLESDGGVFRSSNWLNTINLNPGNPGALTGANFNTGIANIPSAISYTIGYGTPILNLPGPDFAIVAARFSADDFILAVSTDGSQFTANQTISAAAAVDTGVTGTYYYAGGGPFVASLFLYAVDLTSFGIAPNGSVVAIRVSSPAGGDLIRVVGLGNTPAPATVPEPSSFLLLASGFVVWFAKARRPLAFVWRSRCSHAPRFKSALPISRNSTNPS